MSDEHKPGEHTARHAGLTNAQRGRHPAEEGDEQAPPDIPEDDSIVPNRHSASAEAALMRWHEQHES